MFVYYDIYCILCQGKNILLFCAIKNKLKYTHIYTYMFNFSTFYFTASPKPQRWTITGSRRHG